MKVLHTCPGCRGKVVIRRSIATDETSSYGCYGSERHRWVLVDHRYELVHVVHSSGASTWLFDDVKDCFHRTYAPDVIPAWWP